MDSSSMENVFKMMNNPESMNQMKKMMKNPEIKKLLDNEEFMESMMNMMGGPMTDKMFNENKIENDNYKFNVDDELKLVDLKSELNYNDKKVKIIDYNKDKERYEVEFLDEEFEGKHILVKENNLSQFMIETETNDDSHSHSPSPPPSPKIDEVN